MPDAILGLSAYYHDSAAALIIDGELFAAHEERFTRKKHDPSFPLNAARYVLDEAGQHWVWRRQSEAYSVEQRDKVRVV